MTQLDRRTFLANTALASTALASSTFAATENDREGVTFSFGTYGTKALTTEASIELLAEIGYDGVELTTFPDWDASPASMSKQRRADVRKQLGDAGLHLTSLMAHLRPVDDAAEHRKHLDELRRVSQLGHDLSTGETPVVQSVLGGGKWEEKKESIVRRLADWVKIAEQSETVVCIKPHSGGVMSKPAHAAWVIQQLGDTPWVRMVYDFSHYVFLEAMDETVATALPITAHIAIKDTIIERSGRSFVLPGESRLIDYNKLFTLFYSGGYRGDICCEVSSAVWKQDGYDPVAAAKRCYTNIAPVFEAADIPRRRAR